MNFNLEPPAGFDGLDPDKPLRIYVRKLPHWRQQGATYFVTFHLEDALPAGKLNELKAYRREWEHKNPPPRDAATWTQYAQEAFGRAERLLDAGHGKCWFAKPEYSAELHRSILHFHEKRYEIGCLAILGNHCHLIMRPYENYDLEDEVGAIKSVTSHFVNRREKLTGELWFAEFYDRIIRDAEHLWRVVQYIGDNPRRAGIAREKWVRWFNPTWQALGWDFEK